jgi:8-oxo-dGTP diphosphatase
MSYCYDYPRAAVTVDAAIFCSFSKGTFVLLIQRDRPPYEGMWALPGGFVDMDETLEEAITRELQEETGLTGILMEQLHTFSSLHRDPRHRTISTVFTGTAASFNSSLSAGDDARNASWFPVEVLPELAFDHAEIVQMAIKKQLQGT